MLGADFRTLVLSLPGVAAVVGARVYPVQIPAEVWSGSSVRPCVVYSTTARPRASTFCGPDSLVRESVQLDCYSKKYDDSVALAALLAALLDFSGTVGGTYFNAIRFDSEFDLFEPEPGLYRRTLLLTIWHRSI